MNMFPSTMSSFSDFRCLISSGNEERRFDDNTSRSKPCIKPISLGRARRRFRERQRVLILVASLQIDSGNVKRALLDNQTSLIVFVSRSFITSESIERRLKLAPHFSWQLLRSRTPDFLLASILEWVFCYDLWGRLFERPW